MPPPAHAISAVSLVDCHPPVYMHDAFAPDAGAPCMTATGAVSEPLTASAPTPVSATVPASVSSLAPVPPRANQKRRRAVSPGELEAETRRMRPCLEQSYMVVLASLSPEHQAFVYQSAELGMDRQEPRPRAINRRYKVRSICLVEITPNKELYS